MRRNRLTLDELLEALRAQGVTSLGDVKYAILETSGQLSVLLRADCQPATPSQLGLYVRDDVFLPEVIINDGRLLRGNLERLRLDDAWLKKQLRRCRHTRLRTCSCSPWTSAGASSACEKRR